MRSYRITKVVYASTLSEALVKEPDGMIVDLGVLEEVEEKDWQEHLDRKRRISRSMDKDN